MSKPLKFSVMVAGGLVVLLACVAVALVLFLDADVYRPRLEAAASQALGMDVKIDGRLGIDLFPGLNLTMENVLLGNQGAEVATVKEARIKIYLLPLLKKEVRFGSIALKHPRISIERDHDGKLNVEKSEPAGDSAAPLDLRKISVSNGTFRYLNKVSEEEFEARGCSLRIDQLQFLGGKSSELLQSLSLTAQLACEEVRKNGFTMSDLKASAEGKKGVVELQPLTMEVFGAQSSGGIRADFSGASPFYEVRYALPQFRIEEFFKVLSPQIVAKGSMDFSANLSMQGTTANQLQQTLAGQISLRGKNLRLDGRDLDRELSRFESSQNFNLVDVGAVFFAGPLGLVVTKGHDFARIFQGSGGHSEIRTLVSDWKIEDGVARARDVAMATNEHRIALQGGLDFVQQRFDNLTVALIDAEGCAKVRQSIQGGFQNPVVEPPSVLRTLAGPVRKLYQMGRDLFPGGECEAFYSGSVAPPQ